jgi:hypothetical protein
MNDGKFIGGMDFLNVNKMQEPELEEQVKNQLNKLNSI